MIPWLLVLLVGEDSGSSFQSAVPPTIYYVVGTTDSLTHIVTSVPPTVYYETTATDSLTHVVTSSMRGDSG